MHLKEILETVQDGGLVLLDELGTGTDPKEGAALGIALLQTLSRRHCWILCSTHLGEISQWALRHARFQNASVQFDEERLAPTYRLLVGLPGQSRALTIAARLGLPRQVLEHADRVLGEREQDWRDFLRELEAERTRLSEGAEVLRQHLAAAEKDRTILQQREEKLRLEREAFQEGIPGEGGPGCWISSITKANGWCANSRTGRRPPARMRTAWEPRLTSG